MDNAFLKQVEFSISTENALRNPTKVADIHRRIQQIKAGDAITINDVINASCCFDLPFNALLRRTVLDRDSIDGIQNTLTNRIEQNDLYGVIFIASTCIARVYEDFFFTYSNGKIAVSHMVEDALLEKIRVFFMDNNLPVLARQFTTPKSFYYVEQLPENEAVEAIYQYMFGVVDFPCPDKVAVACFNKLSTEDDKKHIMKCIIEKYQRIKDSDVIEPFPGGEGFFVEMHGSNNESYFSPLYFTDLFDSFETDSEEKQRLHELQLKLKEKATHHEKSKHSISHSSYNKLSEELANLQSKARAVSELLESSETECRKALNSAYELVIAHNEAEKEYRKLLSRINEGQTLLNNSSALE